METASGRMDIQSIKLDSYEALVAFSVDLNTHLISARNGVTKGFSKYGGVQTDQRLGSRRHLINQIGRWDAGGEQHRGDPFSTVQEINISSGAIHCLPENESDVADEGAIYYGKTASAKWMPVFDVKHAGAWHEYPIKVPAETINGLRIDPARGAGALEIEWIRLETAPGTTARLREF